MVCMITALFIEVVVTGHLQPFLLMHLEYFCKYNGTMTAKNASYKTMEFMN